ncbi:diguanylate cyclase [Nocardioides albidus]|uniref:Diguanylate cyclase n=1 Tax=Nocardioides albidus TaxID=1517589 RepID=A0A5C4VLC4_9ACTN|nr:diguanylate cyclase [Nocardioides albidus]TNM36551.1 diguanylate cyclase [Nocardioides albidus]
MSTPLRGVPFRDGARLVAWAATFVAAGALGRMTIIDGGALSLVWPAAGVAMLWFATGERRTRPLDGAVFMAATYAVNVATGAPPVLGLVFVTANVIQVLVFLLLARRWIPEIWGFGGRRPLGRLDELGALVAAALVGALLAALLGTVGLTLTGTGGSLLSFVAWWGRNAVGLVAVGLVGLLAGPPLADAFRRRGMRGVAATAWHAVRPDSRAKGVEAVLLLAVTLGVYVVVFDLPAGAPLAFLVLVPTFWAGMRFSPLTATVHSMGCAATAIGFTLSGSGPFLVFDEPLAQALVAQLCVLMTMIAGLSLAFSHALERHVAAELTSLMNASRLAAMITTDLDGHVRTFGVGAERLLGYAAHELVGRRSPADFMDPAELGAAAEELGVGLADVLPELARREAEPRTWTFVRRDGSRLLVRMALSRLLTPGGVVTGYLGVAIDVSQAIRDQQELADAQARLAHLAHHDALTGLPNRRWFLQELHAHLDRCGRRRRGALLMLDLDHFKAVNDTLGHAAGDDLLVSLAEVLRGRLRRTDAVARLGGDEFAILLADADAGAVEETAAALVRAVRAHASTLDGVCREVSVSVGGVLIDDRDARGLLNAADVALYDAKRAGRDRHVVRGAVPATLGRTG